MIKYKLKEVKPRIFLATFKDRYDMCMTFLRYQECYESPNPKFRGKRFTILDFMEWYSKKQSNGCFEYPKHWMGFNIPSYVFSDVCGVSEDVLNFKFTNWDEHIEDYNKYDAVMEHINEKCVKMCQSQNRFNPFCFYLIASMEGNTDTINHELAHGFYYTIPEYKKEMLSLVKKLKPSFRNKLYKSLLDIGYTKQVLPDETQAFLATGWRDIFPSLNGEDKLFVEVFEKYISLVK